MLSARWQRARRMWRGSPSYGVRSGVRMSQNIRADALLVGPPGQHAKVLGSGMAIMSDSSIALKPVIEEPSKPIPPSNASASSVMLIENALSWPRMSVNHRRMKRMPSLLDDREHVVGGQAGGLRVCAIAPEP